MADESLDELERQREELFGWRRSETCAVAKPFAGARKLLAELRTP